MGTLSKLARSGRPAILACALGLAALAGSGCASVVPYTPKEDLVGEKGLDATRKGLRDSLVSATVPVVAAVDVTDDGVKVKWTQTTIGAFYQAVHIPQENDIYFSTLGRVELYSNNYVFFYDKGGRLNPLKVLFATPEDSQRFIDHLWSLRAEALKSQ